MEENAGNSTVTIKMFSSMDEADFLLFLLLFTIAISYFLMEHTQFSKIWNKIVSTFKLQKYRQIIHTQSSNRFSLLDFAQWHYRGEGNEYLAISLPEQRKILRLRKSACPSGYLEKLREWYYINLNTNIVEEIKAAHFEKLNLEYYKVLVSLIGNCYVQPSEDVLLIRSEIAKINKIISSKRPEHRKKKHISLASGSLLTDYAYLPLNWEEFQFISPTFAVEIKPKQGWIPEKERIYDLCTYCLNQYIKLQNGETSKISNYCPMDLFSGQYKRMAYAINCLLKTPQNNLSIFQDGILVHGDSFENLPVLAKLFDGAIEKAANYFCDLVTKALLKKISTSNNHMCMTNANVVVNLNKNEKRPVKYKMKKCDLNREGLPLGCVLDRILNLQKLDKWGAAEVSAIIDKNQAAIAQQNNYTHAANVVNRAKSHPQLINCAKCLFNNDRDRDSAAETVDLVVQRYLMSAIAKDCSLMLTFRKIRDNEYTRICIPKQNIIKTANGIYACCIGVFDLYPKPLTCISKQVKKRLQFTDMYNHISNNI